MGGCPDACKVCKKFVAPALVAAAMFAAVPAQAQQFVNVLTGGTSGVYYPLGVALGKLYGDKIPGIKTQVQATTRLG